MAMSFVMLSGSIDGDGEFSAMKAAVDGVSNASSLMGQFVDIDDRGSVGSMTFVNGIGTAGDGTTPEGDMHGNYYITGAFSAGRKPTTRDTAVLKRALSAAGFKHLQPEHGPSCHWLGRASFINALLLWRGRA